MKGSQLLGVGGERRQGHRGRALGFAAPKGLFTQGQGKGGQFSHHHGAWGRLQEEAVELRVSSGKNFPIIKHVQFKSRGNYWSYVLCMLSLLSSDRARILQVLSITCPVGLQYRHPQSQGQAQPWEPWEGSWLRPGLPA